MNIFKSFFISLCFLFSVTLKAQVFESSEQISNRFKKKESSDKKNPTFILLITAGLAVGGETSFGPKLDIYMIRNKKNVKPYFGVGGSCFGIFNFANYSANAQGGVNYKDFTFDASLAKLTETFYNYNDDETKATSWTVNPKIGYNKQFLWIKVGPSFRFNSKTNNGLNSDYYESRNYNFEIAGTLRF